LVFRGLTALIIVLFLKNSAIYNSINGEENSFVSGRDKVENLETLTRKTFRRCSEQ
jgi:hypothetical protein